MKLKAGTLPWLLYHELRLWWRGLRGKGFLIAIATLCGLMGIGLLVMWLLIISRSSDIADILMLNPLPAPFLWGAVVVCIFFFYFA